MATRLGLVRLGIQNIIYFLGTWDIEVVPTIENFQRCFCDNYSSLPRHCSSRYCHLYDLWSRRTGHTVITPLVQAVGMLVVENMDSNVQPSTSRKRTRESETELTESQLDQKRVKREKAAERQRRKRERDRRKAAGNMGIMAFSSAEESQQAALQQQQQQEQQEQQHLQQQQVPTQPQPQQTGYQELTPEEKMRRDRVRAAARERQRKHRQLVKQRRMRDLGLEMGNEMMQGMEEVHYRATPDGQYHPVMPPDLQPLPPPHPQLEAPFPHGAPMGGQTFASTLLLSFSCAPLLKQHLLRTLNMSNEELTSLEPIIADAWDRWDHSVGNLFINVMMKLLILNNSAPNALCGARREKRRPASCDDSPLFCWSYTAWISCHTTNPVSSS